MRESASFIILIIQNRLNVKQIENLFHLQKVQTLIIQTYNENASIFCNRCF